MEACSFGVRANWSMVLFQDQDRIRKFSENFVQLFFCELYFLVLEKIMIIRLIHHTEDSSVKEGNPLISNERVVFHFGKAVLASRTYDF